MYDFPIIPIVLFVLMIIPPIIIGFFRGWKASLFIMLATLAVIGIEIGISFAIYDSLWDMLNRFIIDDLQHGLSKDSLKQVGKPTIIILFIGMCMIPTYGIVMGLYFPINKRLRRHLFPKTEEINQHQKSISRSIHWASRTSGMAIAATSGLFFAASASSAAATLFTPIEKRNKFTDFTSDIANLYTFGKGSNSRTLQMVHNFAKNDLTIKYQDDLAQILYFGQTDVRSQIVSSINEMATGPFHDKLLKLAGNPDAMLAVVDLILNSQAFTSKPQFFLEDGLYEELNNDGTKKPGAIVHANFDQMKNIINSYINLPNLNLHLSNSIISKMIEKIKDRTIMPYEMTSFYKRWEDGTNFLSYLNNKKEELISKEKGLNVNLKNQIANLADIYRNINSFKNQIVNLGAVNGSVKIYKYVLPQGGVQTLTVSANGIIHRNEQELASLTSQVGTAQTTYNNAKSKYDAIRLVDDSNRNNMKSSESEMNRAIADRDLAQQEYNTALRNIQTSEAGKAKAIAILNRITDSYLNQIQAEADNAKRLFDNEVSLVKNINSEINALNTTRSAKASELNDEKIKLNNALSEISSHKQSITHLKSELSQLRNDKTTLESQVAVQNQYIIRNNAAIGLLDPVTQSAEIARLTSEITASQNQIATFNKRITSIDSTISSKDSSIQILNTQIKTLETSEGIYKTRIVTLQNEYSVIASNIRGKTTMLTTHINERDRQENIYLSKSQLHSDETDKRANAKVERDRYISDIAKYISKRDLAKNDLDHKNALVQFKTTAYNGKKKIFEDYHSSTYEPALTDMNNKNTILMNLTTKRFNKTNELNDNIAKLDNLINQINAKVTERASKINEIYSTSDKINEINSLNKPPHSGEDHTPGTTKIIGGTYINEQAQTSVFTTWALSTIPGIMEYIRGASKDTQSYKGIMESKRIIYKERMDQYLDKIAEILRS